MEQLHRLSERHEVPGISGLMNDDKFSLPIVDKFLGRERFRAKWYRSTGHGKNRKRKSHINYPMGKSKKSGLRQKKKAPEIMKEGKCLEHV